MRRTVSYDEAFMNMECHFLFHNNRLNHIAHNVQTSPMQVPPLNYGFARRQPMEGRILFLP